MAGLKVERVDDGGQQNLGVNPARIKSERTQIYGQCFQLHMSSLRGSTVQEVARQDRILAYLSSVDKKVLQSVVMGLLESGYASSGLIDAGLLALEMDMSALRKRDDPILLSSDIYSGRLLDLLKRH